MHSCMKNTWEWKRDATKGTRSRNKGGAPDWCCRVKVWSVVKMIRAKKKKKKKTRIGLILRENENEFSTIEREFLQV